MYFCIYLDIPELESWVVAEPHAPALAQRRLSPAAGYLPVGLPGKELALAWAGAACGDLGAGVCVPGHIPLGLSRALTSEMEGEVLDVQVMGRSGQVAGPCSLMEMEDAGVPGRSNGVGRHSGGLGAGGHWELFSSQGLPRFRGSLPLQQHALCLH